MRPLLRGALRAPSCTSGDLRGFWSLTARANWRIIFRFQDGDARDVLSLCKNAEGALFSFQVEALQDGIDDSIHAFHVHKANQWAESPPHFHEAALDDIGVHIARPDMLEYNPLLS